MDIAVVNTRTGKVLLLCEVEEEGASPKKIIGNCTNVFLADSVSVGRKRYDPEGAHFLLGAIVDEKGNAKEKISKLEKRIPAAIKDGVLKGIKLEFVSETDPEVLLDRLEDRICAIVRI